MNPALAPWTWVTGLAAAPPGTTSVNLAAPSTILASLPSILALAWLAGRLLGVRRRSWLSVLVCGFTGWLAGGTLALVMAHSKTLTPAAARSAVIFTIVFTMAATACWELLARPGRRPPAPVLITSLPHPLRAIRRSARRARRYLQIIGIAVRHGLGPYLGFRRRRGEEGRPADPARQARLALDEAGGMFVKLGQMLSTRPDIVTPAVAHELTRLQEHVSPADPEAVRALVEEETGRPVTEVFAEFGWDPVAAASIAQAHRAVLPDGEQVIVKVQRPGIEEAVECDLSILVRLARRIEAHTAWGAAYGVCDLAAEFAANLRAELDFGAEARNMTEMATGLADVTEIAVPAVFAELSTPRMLVMERLQGVSVSAARPGQPQVDQRKLADILLRSALRLMMAGERFHADPHPGNVWLLDDGRLGLLDFGSTGRLDALEQASVADMLIAIRRRDPAQLRDAVLEVATVRKPLDERGLERALARFISRHFGPGALPTAAMLTELLQIFLTLGIAMPPTTSLLFRTLATLEGTLRTLCPSYPLIPSAEDFAAELVHERTRPATWQQAAQDELTGVMPLLRRAPRHLDHLATIIERGQARARLSLFSDEHDVQVVTNLVNRMVLAIIGGVVGLMSVALLALPGGPRVSPSASLFDVFGYLGLFLATVLLLRALVTVMRD
jgi:ubiquinone biosynthesis protein